MPENSGAYPVGLSGSRPIRTSIYLFSSPNRWNKAEELIHEYRPRTVCPIPRTPVLDTCRGSENDYNAQRSLKNDSISEIQIDHDKERN